jgi:glycosyltransferase involved in cell wall biosynthesis
MNTRNITVAAIIPTYNRAHLVRRAIESVLAQTEPVDEIIVVDDGGTDNTWAVVAGFGDRVRYLRRENGGLAAARNTGVRAAHSRWVAFLDDDDEWLPEKTALQKAAIAAEPDAVLCYGGPVWVGVDGRETFLRPTAPGDLSPRIRLKNLITPCATMVRADAFHKVGGFNERLRCVEDWEFNVRLLPGNRLTYVDAPVVRVYEARTSMSKALRNMLEAELSIVDTLLSGLHGISRAVWRRRILSRMYYRAAVSAREAGISSWPWLSRSLLYWPSPSFEPVRFKTMALELAGSRRPGQPSGAAK